MLLRTVVLGAILSLLSAPSVFAATTLPVPFTAQAPFSNWDQPWGDACEETSIVMVAAYYAGDSTLTPTEAHDRILETFTAKEAAFGASYDENADRIVQLIHDFFPFEARVVEDPTEAELKAEIDAGRPVILPLHGPILQNPYFRRHADYHVIVLSGYDDETKEFITQEPGTRHGLDFRYSYATILTALHDFVPDGKTRTGRRVAVFTEPDIAVSATRDGDADGLTKSQELAHGTSLLRADSDNDTYPDGTEIDAGFSPVVNEAGLENGSLIKSADQPHVYQLNQNRKHHIVSEAVFLGHGWLWSQIITVSERFLQTLEHGPPIAT